MYDESGVSGLEVNGNKYYFVKNIQGDIIEIVDGAFNVVGNYIYDTWGKVTNITNSTADNIADLNPFRYRGYYYDTETSLYYLNSRYYNPDLGRFISADGIVGANQDMLGYNLYAYCSNNPVIGYDPDGKLWLFDKWKSGIEVIKKAFVVETGTGKGLSMGIGKSISVGSYTEVTKGSKAGEKYEKITVKTSATALGFGVSNTVTHPYPLDPNEYGWSKKSPLDTEAILSCPISKSEWAGEFPGISVKTLDEATIFIGIDANFYTPFFGGRIKIGFEWDK